jgi:hypothetical protein
MEISSIETTKNLLEKSKQLLIEKNKKYYTDVLDFFNLLFEDNTTEITKIRFKKITLNDNVFNLYNEIIKTYKLNKPEFDIEKFDISEIDDINEIKKIFCSIAEKLSNNLLEKLNYKLKKKINKDDNKIKFYLEII